jgi:uncharacterized protein (TIGR03790 family)
MRPALLCALLLACDTPADSEAPQDSPPPDDTALQACGLASGLAVDAQAMPGASLAVAVQDAGSGIACSAAWSVSSGTLADPAALATTWTLDAGLARWEAEVASIEVTVQAEGCVPETFGAEVTVDWPAGHRALVLYNPDVARSDEVAAAYAEFREVPAENLCPVPATDPTTLALADAPAFAAALEACLEAAGDRVQILVPVWGVPYKVADLVEDIAGTGAMATVSLDAVLFLGPYFPEQGTAYYNPLYQEGDSMAGEYDPFVPGATLLREVTEDWRLPVYLVARIDGADADAAIALVDRAREAQALADAGALAGTVYVDGRWGESAPATDEFGSYEGGEWNMWGTAAVFEEVGAYPVVFDSNPEEFGTEPAPTACPDALYYAGWYSYYHYNDAFTWAPGAVGGHLDSCSACTLREGGTWAAEALTRGITATFGAVNEPYVAGMPEYDQFFLYLLQGATYAEAAYESTVVGGWMMVWVGDPLYRPYPAPLIAPRGAG